MSSSKLSFFWVSFIIIIFDVKCNKRFWRQSKSLPRLRNNMHINNRKVTFDSCYMYSKSEVGFSKSHCLSTHQKRFEDWRDKIKRVHIMQASKHTSPGGRSLSDFYVSASSKFHYEKTIFFTCECHTKKDTMTWTSRCPLVSGKDLFIFFNKPLFSAHCSVCMHCWLDAAKRMMTDGRYILHIFVLLSWSTWYQGTR